MLARPVTLVVRGMVAHPGSLSILVVGRALSLVAVNRHVETNEPLVLAFQLDAAMDDPALAALSPVGCLARILRVATLPDGTARILVESTERAWLRGPLVLDEEGTPRVPVGQMETHFADPIQLSAQAREVARLFAEYMNISGITLPEHTVLVAGPDDPERLADQVAGTLDLNVETGLAILSEPGLEARLEHVLNELVVHIAQMRLHADITDKMNASMDRSQREYQLKEQLRTIRAELGETTTAEAEAEAFRERIAKAGMPQEVRQEVERETERLRRLHTESAEYTILRSWLDTMCDVPWSSATTDRTALPKAQRVLDQDHYGLDKVKERILEYLAVRQLAPHSRGPILCFVGPPGVGKTSLGRSIARALRRSFGRIALGGLKDEAEIRGHRRTYVGALPGRIVRALIRAGERNPVLVLDEIDKVGTDVRGDPASALLEVLDPAQNQSFVDHYLDQPVDLSQVLFIATANLTDPIPPALYDRLEVIEIPGYTEEEKLQIARRFLLPRLGREHGLSGVHLAIVQSAIRRVIRDYTHEAGVRELERQIAKMHRKVARQIVEGSRKKVRITDTSVPRFLGPARFLRDVVERVDQTGVVVGLAWTAGGGDILFVEAAKMPGKHALKLTGRLGDVMKESVEAAMSWLRSNSARYDLDETAFHHEFHLHVPAGAIPKDGPSAGVTMATALASVIMGRPARPRIAMTGEITLRGRVLPVGGIKEKALAARRAGVKEVVLPRRNRSDLEDIPEELRTDLTFHYVDTVDEVLALALAPPTQVIGGG